ITVYIGWYSLFSVTQRHLHGSFLILSLLPIVFLTVSSSRLVARITKLDYGLALLSVLVGAYFAWRDDFYRDLVEGLTLIPWYEQAVGVIMVALGVEACRRSVGWGLTGVVLVLIGYVAFGHWLPGSLYHDPIALRYFVGMETVTNNGIFGVPIQVAGTYAFMFLLFGSLFQRSGGGQLFFDLAAVVAGRSIGGPAKACVVSSGLYGSMSGSPTADVVTTGPITIPLMLRTGISRRRAGAIEAAASCGGAMLPPVMGAVAFLMVDFTGIPYAQIVAASAIAAMLYYLGVFTLIHFDAERFGDGRIAEDAIVGLVASLRRGWMHLIPLGVLIGLLIENYTVPYIAAGSTIAVVAASWVNPDRGLRIGPRAFTDCCFETVFRMVVLFSAVIAAGLVIGAIDLSGLTGKFTLMLIYLAGDSLFGVLLASAVVLVLLGMGMPTPGVYIMGVALLIPALTVDFGVAMLQGHMFLLYLACMSAITPPMAVACFASATIAEADPMEIAIYAVKLAIGGFVIPFFFVFNPGVLLQGSIVEILVHTALGAVVVVTASMAVHGWVRDRPLAWPYRIGFAVLAAAMIYPVLPVQAAAAVVAVGGFFAARSLLRPHPA
ncbi:MAG: TRAP transporter fused permease subunit, partial [Proteobacteria bacterium]|nr:TRAP transporter fused permease subunit [Pseudomonadota bacterium]